MKLQGASKNPGARALTGHARESKSVTGKPNTNTDLPNPTKHASPGRASNSNPKVTGMARVGIKDNPTGDYAGDGRSYRAGGLHSNTANGQLPDPSSKRAKMRSGD